MARILIVEPAAPLREFLRLHPETAGHEVLLAEGTATRAQCARDQQPDLIFTGTGKGGLDGLALLATLRGEGLGSPFYRSPEQALGKAVDQRSDLHSLGVTSYTRCSPGKGRSGPRTRPPCSVSTSTRRCRAYRRTLRGFSWWWIG